VRELLAEREVRPLYGQVVAQDAGTADIPVLTITKFPSQGPAAIR
jgi:hypothetical protein